MNLNKVFLLGRVATPPEIRSTPSGQSVCSFSLATNRVWKDASGQKKEDSQFHRIVLWQKLAETASKFLTKGSLVLIEGRIQNRSWEDKTGNKRYTTEIIGEGLQLGPRSSGFSGDAKVPDQKTNNKKAEEGEDIPIIEDGEEIDIKDIPF
ncbi:MAG: single-stranded DNA-binding protein [Candidatus Pacebacteria bacterium]|nr:single-stranded DNA-binding protein [Candidatus Paceibacterota bacterium]